MNAEEPKRLQQESLRPFVTGSIWMVAMRLGVRAIGLISTIILARVLHPDDFGVVAMAMLMISFFEVFAETGQQSALIRHPNPEKAHYDTAWTISIILNSALTLLVLLASPSAELFFHDPRIVPVIQLLSLRVFLLGLVNIGVIDFRRNLDFRREFKFGLVRKALTFGITIALALSWESYWALAVGTIVGHVMEVVLSYLMHPYRPRFGLQKTREIWGYSIWLLVASLGRFFEGRIDSVAVAGTAPPEALGRYNVAAEIGALPVTEILEPVARALFPNFSRFADDRAAMKDAYVTVLGVAASAACCLGMLISCLSADIVAVLLGPKWSAASSLVAIFAVGAAVSGLCSTVITVLNAAGASRASARQTWLRVALYLPAMIAATQMPNVEGFALARAGVAFVLVPTYFWELRKVLPISWAEILGQLWRPLVATAGAAIILSFAIEKVVFDYALVRVIVWAAIGSAVYILIHAGLWSVARPRSGFEALIHRRVTKGGA